MRYLKRFESINNSTNISSNVIQFEVDKINKEVIEEFRSKYPDKWILTYEYDDEKIIFIKDKPKKFNGDLPEYVYHVSDKRNLDKIGIKTSTKTESPFGYYNMSFFYLNIEDVYGGSVPKIDENFLYKVDTKCTKNWYEGFNQPIDEEENITTSDFIKPEFITKINGKASR